jgi:predicted HTH transcriptional regulator
MKKSTVISALSAPTAVVGPDARFTPEEEAAVAAIARLLARAVVRKIAAEGSLERRPKFVSEAAASSRMCLDDRIVRYLRRVGRVAPKQIAAELHVTRTPLARALARLERRAVLVASGSTRNRTIQLSAGASEIAA